MTKQSHWSHRRVGPAGVQEHGTETAEQHRERMDAIRRANLATIDEVERRGIVTHEEAAGLRLEEQAKDEPEHGMTTDHLTITRHTHLGGATHDGALSDCREHSHRWADSSTIETRNDVAYCTAEGCGWWRPIAGPSRDAIERCESGWTGDRCTKRLFHAGPHSNE